MELNNGEWARVRDKKTKDPISFEEKHENFIAAVRKWEMLVANKVVWGSEKKNNMNTNDISSINF